jgi:hypothetical protein
VEALILSKMTGIAIELDLPESSLNLATGAKHRQSNGGDPLSSGSSLLAGCLYFSTTV